MGRLGSGLVLLSLLSATAGALVAFAAAARRSAIGWRWARRLTYGYAAAIAAANAVMVTALLKPDFAISYVAQVGSRTVPKWVAIVSLWSSLEGSILFWGLVLGIYVAWAAWSLRNDDADSSAWAVGVWLVCAAFFSLLLAGPAHPFGVPAQPVLDDGPGPNPLLQNHVLMAIHPPFLYAGYVGMTIPFGLVAAALLVGRLGPHLLRSIRTWLLVAWTFLTVAIVLGGWWAYEVLGWGGYWAWDPVENASLLPWLTATGAVHSALLAERKGVLKGWTVTLVLTSFLLTILGTFMTRSGVFNSVHSFTQSPIGPTLLALLAAATLFSIVLLAMRIDTLGADGRLETGVSRDTLLLGNNLALTLFTFTVLVGTTFPLVTEAVRDVQMSVGRPYFDRMAAPLGVALIALMGVGTALPWERLKGSALRRALLPPLAGALLATTVGLWIDARSPWALAAFFCGGYAVQVALWALLRPVIQRVRLKGERVPRAVIETITQGRRHAAAQIVHIGVAMIVVAVSMSSTRGITKEVQLAKGAATTVGGYTLTFTDLSVQHEPHREALVAGIDVTQAGAKVGRLSPAMNYYATRREPIGTPAVRSTALEDLYVSLASVDTETETIALTVFVNPLVVWIWVGMVLMAGGGILALWPTRRRTLAASEV